MAPPTPAAASPPPGECGGCVHLQVTQVKEVCCVEVMYVLFVLV